ncbi:EAL domain-containing protein [Deinococcus sp.]|uniref:sensor domain-containing protein n=1 Tax=Deinococcus sp. TaxID=47478 RepID=UPI003C7E015C
MNPETADGQRVGLGALLAVVNRQDALTYLSPELQRLLQFTGAPGRLQTPFWSVVSGQDFSGGWTAFPAGASRQRVLVRLHSQNGQTRTAHMSSTFLPEEGLTLHGFLLETGEQTAARLNDEQVRQMLYQLPVAAVGVGLAGQLLYVNAQAIRNAEMIEGAHQNFIGLNDAQYSELRGQDSGRARKRTEHLQTSVRERRQVSWIDQIQLPGQPPEYWRRSYTPVYNERGDLEMLAGLGMPVTEELHHGAELQLLGQVAQNSSEAVLVVDLSENVEDSRIIFANRVALRLLAGGERRPLTGQTLMGVSMPLINDEQRQALRQLLLGGRGTSGPVYSAQGTPSERCLELSVVPGGAVTSRGGRSHLCLTIRDITEAHRAASLEQGRSRALQLALNGAPLREVLTELVRTLEGQFPGLTGAVMLLRGDHLFFETAPGLPTELVRLADGRRVGPGNGPCALAVHLAGPVLLADLQQDERFRGDQALARTFGIRSLWSLPFRGKQGQVLGTFAVYGQRPRSPRPRQLEVLRQLAELTALLTESRQASDLLERVAYHDALTGLPNRSAFMQTLEERLGEVATGRAAVALIDLTGFRAINEAYGQVAGNRLLQQVAGRLQEVLDGGDPSAPQAVRSLLARLGGDEFALLLPDLAHPDELPSLSARIQQAIAAPFQVGEQEVALRASIGWSLYPDLALDAATLLSQADTAMYTARQEGRAQRLYSQHGNAWSLSPTTIRAALETALDQGQLHLAYQPLISRGGEVRSFEALLRWTHPEYGQVGPDQFIPVAEMSGMIRHIGLWVLQQAAQAALAWPDGVLVNVNISGRQFEHPGFAAEVAGLLAQTGLPAHRLELELELTESALMVGSEQAVQTLAQLSALGVQVALDDYGVGYSNLMRLHTLPISTVKIDRSFTRDLLSGEPQEGTVNASAAIIRSVVGLAHDLGLEVVAEGIETPEQLGAVMELGCDAVQGYLYSRPLPAQAALDWLLSRERT